MDYLSYKLVIKRKSIKISHKKKLNKLIINFNFLVIHQTYHHNISQQYYIFPKIMKISLANSRYVFHDKNILITMILFHS